MPKRMLIDATHAEEMRVAIIDQNLRLEHLDIVHAGREPLKGNIYLAKVKRIEPSLQAAFVEYDDKGEKRHGFLSFAEIHPDYFRIPIADRNRLREALARIEEKAAEAAARGESIDIDSLTGFVGSGETFDDSERDPFAPISLDDDADDDFHSPISLIDMPVARVSQPIVDEDAGLPLAEQTAQDVEDDYGTDDLEIDDSEAANENNFETGETDSSVEQPDAPELSPEFAKSYETIGGDDDLEEQRRRIRRQFLRNYRIQEVIKRGQVMLIQVVKEERGNKGAALTTYLSLAGRYCVLMPNSDKSGGVSRKISNPGDRRRLKETLEVLDMPEGMSVILRTAGVERTSDEIKRDFDYLVRLWDQIREQTMQSTAPALIYEEANLIKRAIRDHYARDMDAIVVEGAKSFKLAQDFMKLLMPSHVERVAQYEGTIPLFTRFQIETQIDQLYEPIAQLKSGGYIVINPTEALVSIDVNSGRATRDRHIEETALRTNMEAAEEVARQLRLRDLAGLVVIDFIDMEDYRHNNQVERKLKESMKHDRARLQIGRISGFGLLELSRQRLRASLLETNFEKCPHCAGTGHIRSADSAALSVLRAIEDEGIKQKAVEVAVDVPNDVALYVMNEKREVLSEIEARYGFRVYLRSNEELLRHEYKIERLEHRNVAIHGEPVVRLPSTDTKRLFNETAAELGLKPLSAEDLIEPNQSDSTDEDGEPRARGERSERGGRNRRRGGRNRRDKVTGEDSTDTAELDDSEEVPEVTEGQTDEAATAEGARRRRGRRGGRRRGPLGLRDREGAATGEEGEPINEEGSEMPAEGSTAPRENNRESREGNREGRGRNRSRSRNRNRGERNGEERAPREGQRDPNQPQGNKPEGPSFGSATLIEIDTTPKPHVANRQDSRSHDGNVNQTQVGPDGQPKAGWWRRWTGA